MASRARLATAGSLNTQPPKNRFNTGPVCITRKNFTGHSGNVKQLSAIKAK